MFIYDFAKYSCLFKLTFYKAHIIYFFTTRPTHLREINEFISFFILKWDFLILY